MSEVEWNRHIGIVIMYVIHVQNWIYMAHLKYNKLCTA